MQQQPFLQSSHALQFTEPESVARNLQSGFTVLDVGSFRGQLHAVESFSLRSATVGHGDLLISSFAGTGLHSHLDSDTLAFFVLPGRGIGHYRLLDQRMNVTAGETVGYIPPCAFQVTNTVTAGTLIGFSLAALQRRIAAIGGDAEDSAFVHPELLQPRTVSPQGLDQMFLLTAILDALRLIDQSQQLAAAPLPAAMALDDLVLRSIALLLAPQPQARSRLSGRDLQQAVDLAMAWMRANLERPISLTDVELQVGYSRRSLQLGFQQRVGCGPMQWLRRQRLEASHALIAAIAAGGHEPLSIRQVARRCGYLSLASFSRDFSRCYGAPPSRLLRRRG